MNQFSLLFLFLLCTTAINCQIFKPDPIAMDFFNKGSESMSLGNYHSADSLYTLALCRVKNENIYFNRAISKLMLTDTIGFCSDIDIAANRYFDQQSKKLFDNLCCESVDTSYYNKQMIKSNNQDYRYYEIIKQLK